MIFSYNWLQSFFDKKLPLPEKLAQVLTMRFAEVEEVKKKNSDFVLDIDVRPNRAGDCFSHFGIAREISAILGYKIKKENLRLVEDKKIKSENFISLKVKDKRKCPRYSAKIITDVKVDSSPKWIKERLKVCGLRPINNIVDIANYVMLETGQPLHAFDFSKIGGKENNPQVLTFKSSLNSKNKPKKIIVRSAEKREKITTLDGEKYDLDKDILVIADKKEPLAIAGVKGGKKTEIDKKTKTIILESANFDSQTIRKSSKKLKLKTDASLRFEHGIDLNLTEKALVRASCLIKEIAGGQTVSGMSDFYPSKVLPKKIKLDLNYVEKLLGIKIPQKKMIKILVKLGLKPSFSKRSSSGKKTLTVLVPTFRIDLSIAEDLIEEIGRIYGYDNIPESFPISVIAPPKENNIVLRENKTKDILKEIGFSEVYNYSFFSEREADLFAYQDKELVELENPLSEEQKYLRASLIPGLLKNIKDNLRHFSEIKIFELGKVFKNKKKEERRLTGAMTGDLFYQAKGAIDLLLERLGVSDIRYLVPSQGFFPEKGKNGQVELRNKLLWHSKKCAEIKVNNLKIGFLGEISPKITSLLGIKKRTILFDINFDKLLQQTEETRQYKPISRFPSSIRDIAVLVPKKTKVIRVLDKIYKGGGKIIQNADLFDIYQGKEIPFGKKNLAFRITYQADEKPLSSKEIEKIQNKIINALEKEPKWQVRK